MNLRINEAYLPAFEDRSRYLNLYGGAGSGKSVAACQKVLTRILTEPGHKILSVRKVARTIRNSSFSLLRELIADAGLYPGVITAINKSEMEIVAANGNSIITAGLDDVEKIKSIHGVTSIHIEEATELADGDFTQLDLRLRGQTRNYKQIILTYNPISAQSWLKARFHDTPADNCRVIKTTYRDNAFIDEEYKAVIEGLAEKDAYSYQVYGLGDWGQLGNLVFTNYVIEDIPTEPEAYDAIAAGLDFGFNNPSAFIKVGLKDDELYIFGEFYQKGLTNSDLIEAVRPLAGLPIIADSAEPQRILEFNRAGIRVTACTKGAGSVKDGLDWMKRRRMHIHPACVNIIKEVGGYKYREDRDGNIHDEPVPFNDHALDGARYATEHFRAPKRQFIRT